MRDERTNPLNPFAFVAIFSIAIDLCHAVNTHELSWIAALRTLLAAPFLVFYFLKSPLAWLVCLLSVLPIYPIYFGTEHLSSPSRVFSAQALTIAAVIYVGWIIYMFVIRRRYYSYLQGRSSST
jgi:hypothetical protein